MNLLLGCYVLEYLQNNFIYNPFPMWYVQPAIFSIMFVRNGQHVSWARSEGGMQGRRVNEGAGDVKTPIDNRRDQQVSEAPTVVDLT